MGEGLRMKHLGISIFAVGIIGVLGGAFGACSQQSTFSSDAQKQAELAAQAKDRVLDSIAGQYCGVMNLVPSGEAYDVNVTLSRTDLTVHSAQTNGSYQSTVLSPTLIGGMRLAVFEGSDFPSSCSAYKNLCNAMGGVSSLSFPDGGYDESTNKVTLGFSIPGYSGLYGNLTGTIANGHFSNGVWTSQSDSQKTVGTFDLTSVLR